MAASLITRTGLPSALAKLKPTQPLPKCFGSFVIRPFRTRAGKPIEATSNFFHSRTVSLNLAIICSGLIRGPEANSRWSRGDMSNFTCVPPISTTRTLLFMRDRRFRRQKLTAGADRSAETLENALALRLCRCAGRPAFYNFERDETKQRQADNLQIESQVLRNLLNGSDPIELRSELSLIRR